MYLCGKVSGLIYSYVLYSWSFGVLLWEMFSFGIEPYAHMKSKEVITFLMSGHRMDLTAWEFRNFPGEIYQIMLECWHEDPNERPTIVELEEKLKNVVYSIPAPAVSIVVSVLPRFFRVFF